MEKTTEALAKLKEFQKELGPKFDKDSHAQAIARGLLVHAHEESAPAGQRGSNAPSPIRDRAGSMMANNVTTPTIILNRIEGLLQETMVSA